MYYSVHWASGQTQRCLAQAQPARVDEMMDRREAGSFKGMIPELFDSLKGRSVRQDSQFLNTTQVKGH